MPNARAGPSSHPPPLLRFSSAYRFTAGAFGKAAGRGARKVRPSVNFPTGLFSWQVVRERVRHEHEKRVTTDEGDRCEIGNRVIAERAIEATGRRLRESVQSHQSVLRLQTARRDGRD